MSKLIDNCEFKFKCPLLWENLTETEDGKIRFCGECKRKVYFCENDEELKSRAEAGECVAVNMKGRFLGMVEVVY